MDNINLCKEIIKEAQKLGLKQSSLEYIQTNQTFIDAYDKNMAFQRAALTTLLFRILISGNFQPPPQIRIALNSANDHISWLDDIKIVVIPFIVENQDNIFI